MSAHATDPRTAARVATLRAACALPLVRAHGSLEGRAGGDVLAAAMEPDGRHVALVLRDAVERWALDPLACVGRWEAAAPATAGYAACVGEAPAGLRFSSWNGLWRATPDGAWVPLHAHPRTLAQPDAPDVLLDLHRREVRVVDLASGATLRLDALPATARELLWRPFPRLPEAGVPWRSELALSRDGRLLWGALSDGRDGGGLAFRVDLDAPADEGPQWPLDGAVRSCRAGRERFAVSTWNDALWLLDLRGDVRRVAWPGGCEPLAFAPDDGALWVRDAGGLVVEVSTRR